jgi:hypothetical protein
MCDLLDPLHVSPHELHHKLLSRTQHESGLRASALRTDGFSTNWLFAADKARANGDDNDAENDDCGEKYVVLRFAIVDCFARSCFVGRLLTPRPLFLFFLAAPPARCLSAA